jgi:DNA polymerase-3 subunit epsilon
MPRNLLQMLIAIALATAGLAAGAWWLFAGHAPDEADAATLFGEMLTLALVVAAGFLAAGVAVQALLVAPLRRRLGELGDLGATGRALPAARLAGLDDFEAPLRRIAEALERQRQGPAEGAAADTAQAQLEAILRDLSEGVVVCNFEHQVLLYNRVALWLLGRGGVPLGLGRPVTAVLDEAALLPAVAELRASPRAATRSLILATAEGARLDARLTLTRDAAGRSLGYVLTLASKAEAPPPDDIEPRPEFYDFDLFHRPLEDAALLDTPLAELAYVVFDCETTGLRPEAGDRLVSIGAVRVVNGRPLRGESFAELIDPGRPIPPASSRIHGLTDADVAGAAPAAEVLRRFHDYARGAVLVAHNAAFDMTFLTREAADGDIRFEQPVLDTLLLSAVLQPHQMEHDLDSLVRRFGIGLPPAERHTALGDARATAEVLVRHLALLEARGATTLRAAIELERRSPHRGWRSAAPEPGTG